ncbi:hypothetical protein ACFZB5_13885 [Streptomyces nodosus]|uniref:hypothetical protein n=1 Tax=Streptomyces nodosus TaxID=40318 RepID=UPI0036EBC5A4
MSLFGRRERRETAELQAYADRLRTQRDAARAERDAFRAASQVAARQFSEADATSRRLEGRVLELGRRNSTLTESDPEYAASLEHRVSRLLKAVARLGALVTAERHRADRLQRRLDDALGLNTSQIDDGRMWQHTRTDKKGALS